MKNKQNGFVPRVLNIRYIKTLNFAKMKSMTEMPRAFQALFNHKMEMQINDTVIAFEKGNMYVKSIRRKFYPFLFYMGK